MKVVPVGGNNNDGLFRAENGTVYFRKYREGKGEIFRSCKTKNLDRARKVREDLMAELWGEKPLRPKRQTVGELWAAWYAGMKETKRPATASSIDSSWKAMKSYIETKFLDEITEEWWTNEYIPKKRQEVSPRTEKANPGRKFFNDRKWLSMFLLWCERNGKTESGWRRRRLINPDPETEEGLVYSDEQLAELAKHSTLRMATLLCMGAQHFMRRSEAILLSWNRVDMTKRVIILRAQDTKIKKARSFPFNQQLFDLFQELKAENAAIGLKAHFVFPTLVHPGSDFPMSFSEHRTLWEGACEKAEMPKGSRFHWLRHTGLTRAFKAARLDAARICHFAGLSLEEADRTYLHFKPDDLRGVEDLTCSWKIRGKAS